MHDGLICQVVQGAADGGGPLRSAVEHGPAFVVEAEYPDLAGKLSALPLALAATRGSADDASLR
jgi:hypothetical protein